jgi:hypothetical protein
MIQGFEKYTFELTDFEKANVLPIVVKGLSNKIGKENAVSNKYICDTLNKSGMFGKYKLQQPRIRKIVNHIRITGMILHLCSTSKGYFVAKTIHELKDYLDGLGQRIDSQSAVHDSLVFQMKHFADESWK